MACDLTTIQAAACASGIGREQNKIKLLQLIAQLTCEASQGGGAESCFQCSSGAGAPAAPPAVTTQPASYEDMTNNFTYNWDVPTQQWIPVPKIYKATIYIDGVNPATPSVLVNTIGAIVWTYDALAGQTTGTLAGAFPTDKAIAICNPQADVNGAQVNLSRSLDTIVISASADGEVFPPLSLVIEVYP